MAFAGQAAKFWRGKPAVLVFVDPPSAINTRATARQEGTAARQDYQNRL
jgi:hypothetical protein